MKLKGFEEQIFFATVRITIPSHNGVSIGTGFLYLAPVSEKESCILLVSNRHVYGDPANPIELSFHKKGATGEPLLGEIVIVKDSTFHHRFTGHPDASVDLACLNVSVIGNQPIYYRNIRPEHVADFDHEHLLPGKDVWFVGYPENRFDTRNNLPILRHGYIASIPTVDFEGRREFVIDAHVFRGSSGSPVFTSLGGKYELIGVISQTMIKNQKLQTVPTVTSLAVEQTIGLGIVLKATLLEELLGEATKAIRQRLARDKTEATTKTAQSEKSDVSGASPKS